MHVPGHVRKGSDALGLAGEMLLSGEIYRQSNVVSGLANKRFFVLHGPKPGGPALLCSYRREADAQPSRVWKISKSARCQLTDIVTGKWNLRSEGASTLSALAFGSYSSTTMVSWHGLGPSLHASACPCQTPHASTTQEELSFFFHSWAPLIRHTWSCTYNHRAAV